MSSYYGLILVVLTFVSGLVWLIDSKTDAKKRKAALDKLYANDPAPSEEAVKAVSKEPVHVDYAKSFFPILLIIVVLRSFLYEPFQIPSASMKPTLEEGDFILVNKFNYGLHLPVTGKKIIDIGLPNRGDVTVFKSPHTGQDYIKRVIGLPGDTVIYTQNKELYIVPACDKNNAADCPKKVHIQKHKLDKPYLDISPKDKSERVNDHYIETIGGVEHGILNIQQNDHQSLFRVGRDMQFKVPAKSYFVLGDNRDNSSDSRYWRMKDGRYIHYVPEENLVGQAVAIWVHLDFDIESRFFRRVPTGISFERAGAIR